MDEQTIPNTNSDDGVNVADEPRVIIYSTPTCHYCNMTKEFLNKHGVSYIDYNVAEDPDKRAEMIEKSGQMGVPVIIIGDEMLIGFNEEKMKELLEL